MEKRSRAGPVGDGECPLCFLPFEASIIFQCKNGHAACGSCCDRIRKACSRCRDELPAGSRLRPATTEIDSEEKPNDIFTWAGPKLH
ncbi:hypothetical protein ACP4OV_021931 [Aristida adscensionis]